MKMNKMDDSIPKGLRVVQYPEYPVDTYVIPTVGHMADQKGKKAKVLKVVTGTFYIVDFEDGEGPHKWYAEGELKSAGHTKDEVDKAAQKAKATGRLEDRAKYSSMKRNMKM